MKTLAEIESAADTLPPKEKRELIRFLTSRLDYGTAMQRQTDLTAFSGAIRLSQDPLAWQWRARGEWE